MTNSVLIVDDNRALAENIAEILQGDGHNTDVAESAEEALRKALTQEFGVVVTDVRLPGMTGIDLVRMMRRCGMSGLAIVISAHIDEGTASAAKDLGVALLEKPLDLARLNRLVRGHEGSA